MNAVSLVITNRRGRMLAPIACLLLAALTGCATKKDVRTLQHELIAMRAQQDSLYRQIQLQNDLLADSVRGSSELVRATRGQLSNQIRQLNDMMISLQQLLGQTQQRLNQWREEEAERLRQQQSATQPLNPPPTSTESADDLYRTGATKLQEKSATAARLAFEQFLTQYAQHERAPDAQFGLAETYALEEELEDAVTEFEKVAIAYPASARAPEALYRAGQISEERKRLDTARAFYRRVVQRYANAPSARLAQQRLNRLR